MSARGAKRSSASRRARAISSCWRAEGRRSMTSVEDGDALDLDQELRLGEALHDNQRVRGIGGRWEQLVAGCGDQRAKGPMRDVGGGLHEIAQPPAVVS